MVAIHLATNFCGGKKVQYHIFGGLSMEGCLVPLSSTTLSHCLGLMDYLSSVLCFSDNPFIINRSNSPVILFIKNVLYNILQSGRMKNNYRFLIKSITAIILCTLLWTAGRRRKFLIKLKKFRWGSTICFCQMSNVKFYIYIFCPNFVSLNFHLWEFFVFSHVCTGSQKKGL